MKKSDFAINPPCFFCGQESVCLHEVFFGRGIKQIAIKYNLQSAVCREHHNICHGIYHGVLLNPERSYRIIFCDKIKIEHEKLNRIMRKIEKGWTVEEEKYVISCGNKVLEMYKDYLR